MKRNEFYIGCIRYIPPSKTIRQYYNGPSTKPRRATARTTDNAFNAVHFPSLAAAMDVAETIGWNASNCFIGSIYRGTVHEFKNEYI